MSTTRIRFVDLTAKFAPFSQQFVKDFERVLASGWYILNDEVARLEDSVCGFTQCGSAVGVGNGTDALTLSLKVAGVRPGDEVITTPMSYLATTSTIALCGATAVFTDIDGTLNLDPDGIEAAITPRTRAISLVHLAGLPARMDKIMYVADKHGLPVIEDCAQSFGATLNGHHTGTFGRLGAISFHPLKNIGALGDGGMIMAAHSQDADRLRQARNHGISGRDDCDFWAPNSRLDELHAAFLSTQLMHYPQELERRRRLAHVYCTHLEGVCDFPEVPAGASPSYNWIMVLVDSRDDLMTFLNQRGIETKVHYPILIPDLKAARDNCRTHGRISNARREVDRILSLPTAEHISEDDAVHISQQIKEFYALSGR